MREPRYVILDSRGLLEAAGADARRFLQGMLSNDVERVSPERALWAALLTPQGKFLHEVFLSVAPGGNADTVLLDCEAARLADLKARLGRYRLRAKVELDDVSPGYTLAALIGEGALEALGLAAESGRAAPLAGGLVYVDPRLAALGARAVLPSASAREALAAAGFTAGTPADYESVRLTHGVPDGSRDLEVERALLLENGFDELHGVDWDKGCFVGQELTARTRYRALIKKRLVPVEIEGPVPAPGTPVLAEGREAGEMRSASDGLGLALIRLEHLEAALTAGGARLSPRTPDWMVL